MEKSRQKIAGLALAALALVLVLWQLVQADPYDPAVWGGAVLVILGLAMATDRRPVDLTAELTRAAGIRGFRVAVEIPIAWRLVDQLEELLAETGEFPALVVERDEDQEGAYVYFDVQASSAATAARIAERRVSRLGYVPASIGSDARTAA